MSENIKHLNQLFDEAKIRETEKLSIIDDIAKRPFHILSFKGINVIFFLHKVFVDKQVQQSKEFLYKIAMTNAYYYEKYNGEIFNVLDTFAYPLLSDSRVLINRYLKYHKTDYPDSFSTYFGKGIQAILNDDQDSLTLNIKGLKKWSTKDWSKQFAGIITVFEGILIKDKSIIEKGINEIIQTHNKQGKASIVKDFINIEATTMAKLAWIKGLQIDIVSPLIPKELLPINELSEYTGYNFFKEIE